MAMYIKSGTFFTGKVPLIAYSSAGVHFDLHDHFPQYFQFLFVTKGHVSLAVVQRWLGH